jgi:hypothetical protein
MAKGQRRSNKEARKPKAPKPKKTHGATTLQRAKLNPKDNSR